MSAPARVEEIGPGISRLERLERAGWGNNMLLLRLPDGLLVHSPTWLGEGTFEQVEAQGTPRVLFAPNHFHHLSLERFRARYPEALVVAGPDALPGLEKRGHQGLRPVQDAERLLPAGASFLPCEGTKTGETWLALGEGASRTLVVCDAFFNVKRPVTGALGVALRLLQTSPGLSLGKTFPWLALRDRKAYVRWALAQIERQKPTTMLFSHGEPEASEDLPTRLTRLVEQRLG